jgi:hypothetical protein
VPRAMPAFLSNQLPHGYDRRRESWLSRAKSQLRVPTDRPAPVRVAVTCTVMTFLGCSRLLAVASGQRAGPKMVRCISGIGGTPVR